MSDGTKIEWTDATWNPIRARSRETGKVGWFCIHATPGCANCYAEPMNRRLGTGVGYKPGNRGLVDIFVDDKALAKPLSWRKPRMIFVCSMTDLFADFVSDEMIDRVFAVMALAPQHTFQVLTKRADRMRAYLSDPMVHERLGWTLAPVLTGGAMTVDRARELSHAHGGSWPLPNVWLGVSVEDQRRADERIPILLDTPAAVRWISAEPLLEKLYLQDFLVPVGRGLRYRHFGFGSPSPVPESVRAPLDWVVAGGESGPGARPMHPDWARGLRDQCAAAGVPFLFKQWGAWAPAEEPSSETQEDEELRGVGMLNAGVYLRRVGKARAGRLLDGVQHDGYPTPSVPAGGA